MNDKTNTTATCMHCGSSLSPIHVGPCPKCGKEGKKVVVVLQETVSISDKVEAAAFLFFELKDKLYIGGRMVNIDKLELIPDERNADYLKGFVVKSRILGDESVREANELASRFVNYLSFITGTVVSHKRPRTIIKHAGVTTSAVSMTSNAMIVKPQDLDLTKLTSLLNADSRLNQHLYNAQQGLKHLQDNDFAEAIKSFFTVIEKAGLSETHKYKPLRDAVSHQELDNPTTISGVATFGISMVKGQHLNLNDPNIQAILEREANIMKNIVWTFVDKELKTII